MDSTSKMNGERASTQRSMRAVSLSLPLKDTAESGVISANSERASEKEDAIVVRCFDNGEEFALVSRIAALGGSE